MLKPFVLRHCYRLFPSLTTFYANLLLTLLLLSLSPQFILHPKCIIESICGRSNQQPTV
jgi:hypothetical protein